MNFSLQDKPCSNRMADSWFPTAVISHFYSAVYVRGMAHINGMESFWALLRRGYYGTFHHISAEHLHRYVNEFAGRLNMRVLDTEAMMEAMAGGMAGKRLKYAQLIAPRNLAGF